MMKVAVQKLMSGPRAVVPVLLATDVKKGAPGAHGQERCPCDTQCPSLHPSKRSDPGGSRQERSLLLTFVFVNSSSGLQLLSRGLDPGGSKQDRYSLLTVVRSLPFDQQFLDAPSCRHFLLCFFLP